MNFRCSFNRHQNSTFGRVLESATVDCVETGPLDHPLDQDVESASVGLNRQL